MLTKITNFGVHPVPEGMRIVYCVSQVDDSGNVVNNNAKKNCIVLDETILGCINTINNWLLAREEG